MTKYNIRMVATLSLAVGLMACGVSEDTQTEAQQETARKVETKVAEKSEKAEKADLVIIGKIYTGSDIIKYNNANYIAITDGKISAIGVTKKNQNFDATRVIHLKDNETAFPGFVDAHAHMMGIGMREMTLNLEGTASIDELKKNVAGEVSVTPKGQLVYGRGWIETGWPEGRFPNATDLDAIAPDHPVYLQRADGHAAVVNTMAMEMAGITDETPDPEGGKIIRDENGKATGMLIDNAEMLVASLMAEPSRAQRKAYIKKGAEVYAKYGWTGMHNMSVPLENVHLQRELDEAGEMPIRVYNNVVPEDLQGLIDDPDLTDDDFGHFSTNVTARGVKFYVDGALGSRGALLHEPYQDDPNNSGLQLMQKEEAKAAYELALANDIQVTTHAIGDLGNTLVLHWYKEIFDKHEMLHKGDDAFKNYHDGKRWRVEHAQVLRPKDIPMFHDLGVIASMQPSHAIGDLHFAKDRVGVARLAGAYAWQDLIDAGAIVVGGTDAPVERGDPMIEFYAMTVRKDLKGFSADFWNPEQAVSRFDAMHSFTSKPAFTAFQGYERGVLEVGNDADVSIFNQDIIEIAGEDIPKTKAAYTIVAGKVVYERK